MRWREGGLGIELLFGVKSVGQSSEKQRRVGESWQSGKLKSVSSLSRLYLTEALCGHDF